MTGRVPLTYVGPLRRGIVALPGRHVSFEAGATVEFDVDELVHLDADCWSGPRSPLPPAHVVVAGTVAAVRDHLAVHPDRAGELLAAELAGRARPTLVAVLEAAVPSPTHPVPPTDSPLEA